MLVSTDFAFTMRYNEDTKCVGQGVLCAKSANGRIRQAKCKGRGERDAFAALRLYVHMRKEAFLRGRTEI